jgi:integrase
LVKLDLPYLWAAKKGRYWFYRRSGQFIPIRLRPADDGFLEAYERIHRTFAVQASRDQPVIPGTLSHLISQYRASPDFAGLADRTRKDYGQYLDILKRSHGHRPVATMPREAVLRLRDEYSDKPRTSNYLISVLRLIFSYAADRQETFRLPSNWINPAQKPKRLREGPGHRPWEEAEIAAYRKQWPIGKLERVLFETFLNTGQRGEDIAPMIRRQYHHGEIAVLQQKTRERVWIPASQDLRDALDPWLAHDHVVLFPTATGRQLQPNHMRHLMRAAIRAAALPDDCTLHGLRYTFATRGLELGLDWQTVESIVGHRTAQMANKYTAKRRHARLVIATLDAARKQNRDNE